MALVTLALLQADLSQGHSVSTVQTRADLPSQHSPLWVMLRANRLMSTSGSWSHLVLAFLIPEQLECSRWALSCTQKIHSTFRKTQKAPLPCGASQAPGLVQREL